jgi:hypothetical protein
MQKSGKSTPKRDQFHKVPASGEVVNDGRQTALLHGKDSGVRVALQDRQGPNFVRNWRESRQNVAFSPYIKNEPRTLR